MCNCLILFKSLTHAQRASKYLEKNGISTIISRPPMEINENSCGYALKIQEHFLNKAILMLKEVEISNFKVYVCTTNGTYKERIL
ncbi:MAG: DUF3343 domain-containing protein [Clostridiales bacterium]|nr:DUF3343 domain-containing protein [Clostridiales bacterium]